MMACTAGLVLTSCILGFLKNLRGYDMKTAHRGAGCASCCGNHDVLRMFRGIWAACGHDDHSNCSLWVSVCSHSGLLVVDSGLGTISLKMLVPSRCTQQ